MCSKTTWKHLPWDRHCLQCLVYAGFFLIKERQSPCLYRTYNWASSFSVHPTSPFHNRLHSIWLPPPSHFSRPFTEALHRHLPLHLTLSSPTVEILDSINWLANHRLPILPAFSPPFSSHAFSSRPPVSFCLYSVSHCRGFISCLSSLHWMMV